MSKDKPTYDDFLLDVSPFQRPYIDAIHELLTGQGCTIKLEQAKSGYVVSFLEKDTQKTIANFVFRKKGIVIRIYADHIAAYEAVLDAFPVGMKKTITKAGACRRMLDASLCNPRCRMGNVYHLDGEEQKKCRYTNFMFIVDEESTPHILTMLSDELKHRQEDTPA